MTIFDRLGALLDRRRVLTYAAMLLGAEIAVASYFVVASHGWLQPTTAPVTTDFVSFYAAGTLAVAGTPELTYHPAEHFRAEQAAREPGIEYNYFYYPPVFLMLCALLARLPYITAFLVFELISAGFYLLVATKILGGRNWATIIPLLAFPIVFWNFGLGQNGFLTAALVGAGTLLVDRKPTLAGLLFGAVCYKPHFGALIPVALAAGRHWRAFAAAAVSVVGLVALSLAVFGWSTWHDFFAATLTAQTTYETGGAKFSAFVTPFGAVVQIGGSVALAYAVQAVAAIVAIGFVGFAWQRRLTLSVRAAMLASATVVAVPLALFYDLLLAAVAAAWLCRLKDGVSPAQRLVFAACYLALLDPVDVTSRTHLPVGAIAAVAIMAIAAHHTLREARNPAA